MFSFPLIFWTLFILIGILLICFLRSAWGQRNSMRLGILIAGVSLVMTFFLLECTFRIRHRLIRDIPIFININSYFDAELGWKGVEQQYFLGDGNLNILVVGDSFTEGLGISKENLYPAYLSSKLGANVLSYAGRGYGTLQELIVLQKYIKSFHPDRIILQLCSNDIINNSRNLEQKSYYQNALMMRPYLEDGRPVLGFPHPFGRARFFLTSGSRFAHFLFTKIDTIQYQLARKGYLLTVESLIAERGISYKEYAEAVRVTTELLRSIKRESGSIRLYAFLADDIEPAKSIFQSIASELDIDFIDKVSSTMTSLRKRGKDVFHPDTVHWNESGHKRVGNVLSRYLIRSSNL